MAVYRVSQCITDSGKGNGEMKPRRRRDAAPARSNLDHQSARAPESPPMRRRGTRAARTPRGHASLAVLGRASLAAVLDLSAACAAAVTASGFTRGDMHLVFVHAAPLTHSTFLAASSPARRPCAQPVVHPQRLRSSFRYWHSPRRRRVSSCALEQSSAPQEAFLQCIQCLAVYHVDPDELEGPPRVVACSACLHEWYANENDLIWGDEQANAALALAAERTQGSNAFVAARGVDKKEQPQTNDGPINVFVGNLSFRATEEDLYRAFSGYGAVLKCEVPADSSGIPKGYAFVEMQSRESGMKAIECLQGTSIVGRDISLSIAKPRTPLAKKAPGKTRPKGKNKLLKRTHVNQIDKELTDQTSPN